MSQALRAEWTKLRSLPGTAWLLIGTVALTVSVSAAIAAAAHVSVDATGEQDPIKIALLGIDLGQAVLAVLAVLAISDEYGTGMIRVSLAAMPRRLTLLGAKAANLAGLSLITGALAVTGCLIAGRLLLPGAGLSPSHGYALISIGHAPTLRAAVGSIIYLILITLLALGIATAVRDTAVSIGTVVALLYLPPLLAQAITDPTWQRHLHQVAPMTAGLAIQTTTGPTVIGPWAGLGVLTAWTAAALIIGSLLLQHRNA